MEKEVVGPSQRDIILHTRKRQNILNCQCYEFSNYEKNLFPYFEKKFPKAIPRTVPIPIYNCHGLTFASRRTRIFYSDEIQKILADDGYTEVKIDEVKPGDIIVYYSGDGDVEHSGLVVSEPDKQLKIPYIVSKWGCYREMFHWANDCPYTFMNAKYYRVTK